MKQLKKISLRSVSEFITEPEMKRVTGGYEGTGPGSPCYSFTGTCHSICAYMGSDGIGRIGTCQLVSLSYCQCITC